MEELRKMGRSMVLLLTRNADFNIKIFGRYPGWHGAHHNVTATHCIQRRSVSHIIDGKAIANNLLSQLKLEAASWKKPPYLTAVLVGNDPASIVYINNKMKAASFIGVETATIRLPDTVSQSDLVKELEKLNENPLIDGILLQLPLPKHICAKTVCNIISPDKDVDGFTYTNLGKFCLAMECLMPCTALAVRELLLKTNVDVANKNVTICGRSKHVGFPIALMLQSPEIGFNATTTVCHQGTPYETLVSAVQAADVVISATGVPELIKGYMVKRGAVVIDVGITRVIDEKTSKVRLVGDVSFDEVKEIANHITPVPGGVGPVTVAMLMKNTVLAAKMRR